MRPRCRCGRYTYADGTHRFCVAREECPRTHRLPLEEALPEAKRLIRCYGSIRRAGRAYDERHGFAAKSGERLLLRILHGQVSSVLESTVDRLMVT